MKKSSSTLILAFVAVILALNFATAQRRVSPVESSDELRTLTKEELRQIKEQATVRAMRSDSLTLDSLRRDSIDKAANRVTRPLLMSAAAGVDIWNPLMRAFGQSYGGVGFWLSLNLKNRFIPVVEFGMGQANATPEDGNFSYKTDASLFWKIGMDYNFMANKDPKYQLVAGFRVAGSSFNFDVTDASISNGYWGKDASVFSLRDQHASAIWGELVLGISVELFRNVSMGWSLRYSFPFSNNDPYNARAWYIPGHGSRDNRLNATLSISYTLPLHKEKAIDGPAPSRDVPAIEPPDSIMRQDTIVVPDRRQRVGGDTAASDTIH